MSVLTSGLHDDPRWAIALFSRFHTFAVIARSQTGSALAQLCKARRNNGKVNTANYKLCEFALSEGRKGWVAGKTVEYPTCGLTARQKWLFRRDTVK